MKDWIKENLFIAVALAFAVFIGCLAWWGMIEYFYGLVEKQFN